jgi:site-specific DNA-cytosine methylase
LNFRAIEFFSGIGGWRFALEGMGQVASAFDISEIANSAYKHNFGISPQTRELATISVSEIGAITADTWLMSPPCQPFCRMGNGLDLQDSRSAAFKNLVSVLPEIAPKQFVLENVEGFLESCAFDMLAQSLDRAGLKWHVFMLCPTQFGIPNRRPRVYVVANLNGVRNSPIPSIEPKKISNYLDRVEDESLYLCEKTIERHGQGMDVVTSESCRSACFIGGYGKRLVGSGSFLKTFKGIRRFSPKEISRLLGYSPVFCFPPQISTNNQYRLLGNGLNLVVARWVINHLG